MLRILVMLPPNGGALKSMRNRTAESLMAYDHLITRLRQRFPELTPATHAPPLLKLRLLDGLSLVGRRGEDAETGTYIKTFTLRFFGIPLFVFPHFVCLNGNCVCIKRQMDKVRVQLSHVTVN
jgi:hypothetical protein